MSRDLADHSLFLFVPANRPDRFAKAASSGADAIIVDLEDAVAVSLKTQARALMRSGLESSRPDCPVYVRVNGIGTTWHADDLRALAGLELEGIVLPKVETPDEVVSVRRLLSASLPILAIVESARGLSVVDEIATAADRLVFGSVDFALDLGMAHDRETLQFARGRIVLAARVAGKAPPIDGVSLVIGDDDVVESDARHGARMGFGGKLLIHPAQVGPARRGFSPSAADVARATRITAGAEDGAARAVDGVMVDAPVLAWARRVLRLHQTFSDGAMA